MLLLKLLALPCLSSSLGGIILSPFRGIVLLSSLLLLLLLHSVLLLLSPVRILLLLSILLLRTIHLVAVNGVSSRTNIAVPVIDSRHDIRCSLVTADLFNLGLSHVT